MLLVVGYCIVLSGTSYAVAGSYLYEAEKPGLNHEVGKADGDGWVANSIIDKAGYLSTGPFTTILPAGAVSATFRLQSSNNTLSSKIITIDIYNAATQKVLSTRDIYCKEFYSAGSYQDFTLSAMNPSGSRLEFRVYWHGIFFCKLDKIISRKSENILLLVKTETHNLLKTELEQYKSDVELRFPSHITIQSGNWTTPDQVRSQIKTFNSQYPVSGIVLVGNVPMHKFYMHEGINAHPLYYEAFEIEFTDKDGNDGIDEHYTWKPNMVKAWVANIRCEVSDLDLGIIDLKKYFTKVHNYYTGVQIVERRTLAVGGADWPGSAQWWSNNRAKPLFGASGDFLDSADATKSRVLGFFKPRPYFMFHFLQHSNEVASDFFDTDIHAEEIYTIPNKALITLHLGCMSSSWMRCSRGDKNNGMSWVFGEGVGQVLIGQVRSGGIGQEDTLYASLHKGMYFGNAYRVCKQAAEDYAAKENPDGSVIEGFLMLGNPFIQVTPLSEIVLPRLQDTTVAGEQKATIAAVTFGAQQDANMAAYSYDGSTNTRWSNDNVFNNAWIQYDLESVKSISSVRLLLNKGATRTNPIKIEVGSSTTTMATVWTGTTSLSSDFLTFDFKATSGRYVRISMTGANSESTNWFGIIETEIITLKPTSIIKSSVANSTKFYQKNISLYDIKGRLVYTAYLQNFDNFSLSGIQGVRSGKYVAVIRDESGIIKPSNIIILKK
jgi:hypothetical protein